MNETVKYIYTNEAEFINENNRIGKEQQQRKKQQKLNRFSSVNF